MRAAISACSVSGIRSTARAVRLGQHADRLLEEQRVPFGLLEQRGARRRRGSSSSSSASISASLSSAPSGSSSIAVARTLPPPHPGRMSSSSGLAEAEKQQRDAAHPGAEVLDQLEQRLLAPVDVLEHEDERLRLRKLLGPGPRGPGDLLLVVLGLHGLEDAGREPHQVGHGLVRAAVAELLDRVVERVVVGDPGSDLDHVGEPRVGHALAVGQRAAEEDRGRLEPLDELSRQPALADSRVAEDREQVGAAVADRPRIRVLQELELRLPADERRREAPGRLGGGNAVDAPGPDRLGDASGLDRPLVLDLEAAERQPVGAGADQDRVRLDPPAAGGRRR